MTDKLDPDLAVTGQIDPNPPYNWETELKRRIAHLETRLYDRNCTVDRMRDALQAAEQWITGTWTREDREAMETGIIELIQAALAEDTSTDLLPRAGRADDVCVCGDYRCDHDETGCRVCRATPTPWSPKCARFVRLDTRAAIRALRMAEKSHRATAGALANVLWLILPLARGYAASHSVGNNQTFVDQAELLLRLYQGTVEPKT